MQIHISKSYKKGENMKYISMLVSIGLIITAQAQAKTEGVSCYRIPLISERFIPCADSIGGHGGSQFCGFKKTIPQFISRLDATMTPQGVKMSAYFLIEQEEQEAACTMETANTHRCRFPNEVVVDFLKIDSQKFALVFFGSKNNSPSYRADNWNQKECRTH